MLSNSQTKEFSARLALLAFHEGVVDSAQLRRCVRRWVRNPDADIAQLLADSLEIESDTIMQLREHLVEIHGEQFPHGPHLTFDEQDPLIDESLADAPASASHFLAEEPQSELTEDAARLGDDELAKRSRRGKKSKSDEHPSRIDYYDSVHERFTRDDRLIPYLFQTAVAYRRKLGVDLRRFWRSTKSLVANCRDWFRTNWRNATIVTVAIAILVPACFFASQFISPNAKRTSTVGNKPDTPIDRAVSSTSDAASQDSPSLNSNETAEADQLDVNADDRIAAIDRILENDGTPQTTDDIVVDTATEAETSVTMPVVAATPTGADPGVLGESNVNSVAEEQPLAGASGTTPPSPLREPPPKLDKEEELRQALQRGIELVKRRQFGRASVILKSARLGLPDSKELSQLLVISQLASKAYDDAGNLLVEDQFADAEDPVWQMLFASWLLEASAQSRSDVRGELLTLTSLRPPTDIVRRCIAWIDAREGKGREALAVLGSKPIFGDRSFADALFMCASLSTVAKKTEARSQLQYAKNKFAELETTLKSSFGPESSTYYAFELASPKIASTINRFAAKLR